MQEADAEINVVEVVFKVGVGGLEVEARCAGLGRAVMLGNVTRQNNSQADS